MILPITLTIAAATALVNLWLAMRVSRQRMKGKVMIGDGEDPILQSRVRAHANLTEYAPLVLILLALVELAGGSPTLLWIAGALFVVARVAHPFGMERPAPNPFRAGGILVTWLVLAALAGWALAIAYGAGTTPAAVPSFHLAEPRG